MRLLAISQYSLDISLPIKLRLFTNAIFAVVPEPIKGSYIKSPLFDHDII